MTAVSGDSLVGRGSTVVMEVLTNGLCATLYSVSNRHTINYLHTEATKEAT